MRIGKNKVAQLVESNPPVIVVVNESDGNEVALTLEEIMELEEAIERFAPAMRRMMEK
jgi:phosphopantothenate synthetase